MGYCNHARPLEGRLQQCGFVACSDSFFSSVEREVGELVDEDVKAGGRQSGNKFFAHQKCLPCQGR